MLELTGDSLTVKDLVRVARHAEKVGPLNDSVIAGMSASRDYVIEALRGGRTVIYGVNTGYGPLANTRIPAEQAGILSRKVVLACVAGVGSPLPEEVVRGMMLIRANVLAKGLSGVRPVIAQTLVEMLNKGVTPLVPGKGSLGASGDLAPLAHVAAVLSRDAGDEQGGYSGRARYGGESITGAEAMARAGIPRVVLEAKEGVALTNGTTFMVSAGGLGVYDAENLIRHAELAAALSLEALLAKSDPFHPALNEANLQPGQKKTAETLRALLADSQLVDSDQGHVQDAYCLRCIPQVLGPVRDVLAFLRERFRLAINAASDNPLIFSELEEENSPRALSGGNFHGQGPALWLDFLGINLAVVGAIAERRVFRLLTPELNSGLPSMLVSSSGLDSGLMMPQYTAAALVSDNKTLAHPDSVDSIPSSANQEDHVSMGANAARHALEILDNVCNIVAIEMLTAAQAIDLRPGGDSLLGRGTSAAYRLVRSKVPFLRHDRETTTDIEALASLIRSGKMLTVVGEAIGEKLFDHI